MIKAKVLKAVDMCDHMVTQAGKCTSCGEIILVVESRVCGDCAHFKPYTGANGVGICQIKFMTVIDTMEVTFKAKDGTCFVPMEKQTSCEVITNG